MHRRIPLSLLAAALVFAAAMPANATVLHYDCLLSGPAESPPNASPGTAGVATLTPAFTGFPLGVTAGTLDHTFDLTLTSTYNSPYVTANGGTAAGAEAALLAAIAAGKAYFNIHTTVVAGGEIRGFLRPFDPTPTEKSTWARVKSLYH